MSVETNELSRPAWGRGYAAAKEAARREAEWQRAEIKRLRAVLSAFVKALDDGHAPPLEVYDAARNALGSR